MERPRGIGINHVAIEVDDVDAAVDFYCSIFGVELRGRSERMAFVDLGDQFLAIAQGRTQPDDSHRHLGLVVDDREPLRERLAGTGARVLDTAGLDFVDPWGNRIQVVEYGDVQYLKHPAVLEAMGATQLDKSQDAIRELREKGISVGDA